MVQGFRTQPAGGAAAPPFTNGPYSFSEDIDFGGQIRLNTNRYALVEQFEQPPALNAAVGVATNLNFEVLGTNMTSALCTFSATRGAIRMTTAGADNDQGILLPHLDTKQTAWTGIKWGTENQVVWEAIITTGDDVATGVLYWAGLKLTNTPTVATDDDQAFFRFSTDDSDTNWEVVYSIGGTDVTADSGVAVAADTQYKLRVEIDEDRKAHFYINDVQVAVSTALTDDVDLIPYVGVQALSGTAEYIEVHRVSCSRIFFE
jgi:hypothetical protein